MCKVYIPIEAYSSRRFQLLEALAAASASGVALLERLHISHQRLNPFDRHGVVDRGAEAADDAVALEVEQSGAAGALQEGGVERRVGQMEADVHQRAIRGDDARPVEAAFVEAGVEEGRLGAVALGHRRQAA